ncbi:hypothetical protein ACLBYD_29370 [Rhodococcus sp. C26F]
MTAPIEVEILAARCDHEDDLKAPITRVRTVTDRTVVIDLIIDDTALV